VSFKSEAKKPGSSTLGLERRPSSPLLVRGEVGAIPIATGEVRRWHTSQAFSRTQAIVVGVCDLARYFTGEAASSHRDEAVRVLDRPHPKEA
jgi:hypothetical protein